MIFSNTEPNIGGLKIGFVKFAKVFISLSTISYISNFILYGVPFSPKLAETVGELLPDLFGLFLLLSVLISGFILTVFGPFLLLQLVWAYWDESNKNR